MKNFIFTESQIKETVKKIIEEQSEMRTFNKAIQCFLNVRYKANLNVDGLMGEQTQKLIERFQLEKKIHPVDGVFGELTINRLDEKDKKIFSGCKSKYMSFFD